MGFIYLYTFPDGSKYVGQTIQKISERCSHHKSSNSNCRRLKEKLKEFKQESGKYDYEFKILIDVDKTLLGKYEIPKKLCVLSLCGSKPQPIVPDPGKPWRRSVDHRPIL